MFKTNLAAYKAKYPGLLASVNLVASGAGEDDSVWHFTVGEDRFATPSYLFARVAGDLGMIEDAFVTKSGREVKLRI